MSPMYGVPQYIDVEDKIAGPLTAKQLVWLVVMGVVLMIMWTILEKGAFFLAAIPVATIFVSLAFYRPYNQPLINFIFSAVSFVFRPKQYVWRREMARAGGLLVAKEEKKAVRLVPQKSERERVLADIGEFAKLLDTEGAQESSEVAKILEERAERKRTAKQKKN